MPKRGRYERFMKLKFSETELAFASAGRLLLLQIHRVRASRWRATKNIVRAHEAINSTERELPENKIRLDK